MPQNMRNRSKMEFDGTGEYVNYRPYNGGYCEAEKEAILNEVMANLMLKKYQRTQYSSQRAFISWQMSK